VYYRWGKTVYHIGVHLMPPATGAGRVSVDGRQI